MESQRPVRARDVPIDRPLADLSRPEQIALLDASLEAELRELGRAGAPEFHDEDDLAWVVGAWPGATVYRTRLDDDIADRRMAALLDRLDRAGLAVTWWAGPSATPPDLRDRLPAHGFALSDDEAGMIADLRHLVEDLPRPERLRFEAFGRDEGIDPRLVEAWLRVAGSVFGWPPERYDVRRGLYLGDDRRPRPWRHTVAWLDGRPVAAARVLLAAGVAMVHGVAVLAEFRRQGIGAAVTLAALQGARSEGYRIGVLQASSMGRGPYERIGFTTVARYGRFERPAAGGMAEAAPAARTIVEPGARTAAAVEAEGPPPPPPVVDAWSFVGPYRARPAGTPYEMDDLLAEHERLGVGARLCLHAESRDGVPEEGNAAMSRIALVTPDTGVIWSVLPPRRFGEDSAERLLGDAEAAGVAMFALFPATHGHHSAPWANGDLYGAMEQARLPLVLDLEQTGYDEVHAIATAHRRLPLVLWGAWYVDERRLVPLLDACPTVRVGLAGDRHIFNPTFGLEQFTARYGPGRLVFGSGWPRQSAAPARTYVSYAAISPTARDAILGGNIRELLADVRWTVRGFEAWT